MKSTLSSRRSDALQQVNTAREAQASTRMGELESEMAGQPFFVTLPFHTILFLLFHCPQRGPVFVRACIRAGHLLLAQQSKVRHARNGAYLPTRCCSWLYFMSRRQCHKESQGHGKLGAIHMWPLDLRLH